MFDRLVVKIVKEGDKMYIHEGEYPEFKSEYSIFQTFPDNLFKHLPQNDKLSSLAHWACSDVTIWLHDIIKHGLQGIASNIIEVDTLVKRPKRDLVAIDFLGEVQPDDTDHNILKLTLKRGGEHYALDLSGAQYGFFEPVAQWDDYCEFRGAKITYPNNPSFGAHKERFIKAKINERSLVGLHAKTNERFSTTMMAVMQTWEKSFEGKKSVRDLLNDPEDTYRKHKAFILRAIDERLEEYTKRLRELHEACVEAEAASLEAPFEKDEFMIGGHTLRSMDKSREKTENRVVAKAAGEKGSSKRKFTYSIWRAKCNQK